MKEHPRYKGYYVTESGDIISNVYKSRNRKLKPANKNGRACVSIYFDGGKIQTQVSRIVAETYLDNFTQDCVVMHLDNDPFNNHVSNLKCGDQSENIKQCVSDGRYQKRYTDPSKIENIKYGKSIGLTIKQISEKYGYPYSTVCDIIRREKI